MTSIQQKLEIYRRDAGVLKLASTLYANDALTSPNLPGLSAIMSQFF
ncbi:MAG: hypothetical protein NW224_02490 [Leptolyngbyaceae cyanobacterium bins.302]|nr:hypothetical protein [Leptolyngbyaceae cyanobacterium bins.302]